MTATAVYSDDQMLNAVANAALGWKERLNAAGRERIAKEDGTRTAIIVLDFGELVVLRDALDVIDPEDDETRRLRDVLRGELDKWLVSHEPIEPPAATS